MPRIALYAGSFDPVTNGHLDVVRHAVRLADRLVIAIGVHPGKTPLFSAEERTAMLHENCAPFAREAKCELSCITFSDLVVDTARKLGATMLIRGVRDGTDLDYEMQMAGMNGAMAPEVVTVFLPASPEHSLSARMEYGRRPSGSVTRVTKQWISGCLLMIGRGCRGKGSRRKGRGLARLRRAG